jgi:hypothetical protein
MVEELGWSYPVHFVQMPYKEDKKMARDNLILSL